MVFGIYSRCFKRMSDIFLSIIAIILLSIPMLIIALLIKLDTPRGKVIFKQTRIGRNGQPFRILKFRSMRVDTPKHMPTCQMTQEQYAEYVTGIGRFIRKYSLDELPQVFNILRGEMSFVGPRPVLANEKTVLEAREKAGLRYFRPGLTGWAQINGRNTLSDEEKARYDSEYINKVSFFFDLYCMFKTAQIVVTKKGFLEGRSDRLTRDADFSTGDEFILAESCKDLDEMRENLRRTNKKNKKEA